MKKAGPSIALIASLALFVGWTQSSQSDWFKGIIYAGSGKVQLTDATGNLVAGGSGTFAGNVAVGGTLAVTGATTLRSTLAVTGNETVGGTLAVTGATTLRSTLAVTGNETVGGALSVTGAVAAGSDLSVAGNETVVGTLAVTGATTLTGNVGVVGTLAVTGALTPVVGLVGTATNNDAAAGRYGEYTESIIAPASAVTGYASNTPKNITSVSLTAGDWDVGGAVTFLAAAITGTRSTARIGTTSANVGADGEISRTDLLSVPTAAASLTVVVPPQRFSLSGTTTVFLVSQITFSGGTPTACGYIRARRVR